MAGKINLCSRCKRPSLTCERVSVCTGRRYLRGVCNKCRNAQQRKRRARNLKQHRKMAREKMKAFRNTGYFKKNPEKLIFTKPWSRLNVEHYLFLTMQRRKYRKGRRAAKYQLMITYEEFVLEIGGKCPTHCPILGIKLSIPDNHRADCLPTVDRLDNSRAYEKGNIAVISRRANIIKSIGTADEHRKIADWMDKMSGARQE